MKEVRSYLQLSKHHHGTFLTRIIVKLKLLLLLFACDDLIICACVRAKTLAKAIQGYDRAIIARFPGGGVAVVVDRREGIAAKQNQPR